MTDPSLDEKRAAALQLKPARQPRADETAVLHALGQGEPTDRADVKPGEADEPLPRRIGIGALTCAGIAEGDGKGAEGDHFEAWRQQARDHRRRKPRKPGGIEYAIRQRIDLGIGAADDKGLRLVQFQKHIEMPERIARQRIIGDGAGKRHRQRHHGEEQPGEAEGPQSGKERLKDGHRDNTRRKVSERGRTGAHGRDCG